MEAAQLYRQHWEREHQEESAKGASSQGQALIRSDLNHTGFKGVFRNGGRYVASCGKTSCNINHLGMADTALEAAKIYLRHFQKHHSEDLVKTEPALVAGASHNGGGCVGMKAGKGLTALPSGQQFHRTRTALVALRDSVSCGLREHYVAAYRQLHVLGALDHVPRWYLELGLSLFGQVHI